MGIRNIPSGVEFKKAIERGVTLVDFSAPWCAPCHFQKPIISKLAHQFKGKVLVASMNIHEHQDMAMKLGIQCVPTMVIFKNSKEEHTKFMRYAFQYKSLKDRVRMV